MTAPCLAVGQTFAGRYAIRAVLGIAPESTSHLATTSSGVEVVVRVIDPALGQRADVMTALGRASAAAAQLPPGCAVAVIDSGHDVATAAPFIVSEYLHHDSLATVAARGPIPMAEVAVIVEGLSRALAACHAQQIAHLALKPTNVFLGPAPTRSVRLADFGAHVLCAAGPSHVGWAAAAPWSAPEWFQPGATSGPPADIFSVALLAFRLLTGHAYWRACASGTPDPEMLVREVMAPRTPVSRRAAEVGVALPGSLDAVFARALSASPLDRPTSAIVLAEALAAAARATPAPSHVGPLLGGIALGLVLGGAVVVAGRRAVDPPSVEPQAAESSGTAPVEHAPSASAAVREESSTVLLTLTCVPGCDELLVDNRSVSTATATTRLEVLPGRHTYEARRAGHITARGLVDLEDAFEKEIRLAPEPVVAASAKAPPSVKSAPPPPLSPSPKPCKKGILKRCP